MGGAFSSVLERVVFYRSPNRGDRFDVPSAGHFHEPQLQERSLRGSADRARKVAVCRMLRSLLRQKQSHLFSKKRESTCKGKVSLQIDSFLMPLHTFSMSNAPQNIKCLFFSRSFIKPILTIGHSMSDYTITRLHAVFSS